MTPLNLIEPTIIVKDSVGVLLRLKALGLSLELVQGTADAWARAEAVRSPFEPNNAPGLKGWIAGTGYYREHLALEGWACLDPRNAPLSLNKVTGISISATSGSWSTGQDLGTLHPTTKNPKGAATVEKIVRNANQLDMWTLLGMAPRKAQKQDRAPKRDRVLSWLMLILADKKTETVRAEVSLPAVIERGRVRHWIERIIVEMPAPGGRAPNPRHSDNDGDNGELDVPVHRRIR